MYRTILPIVLSLVFSFSCEKSREENAVKQDLNGEYELALKDLKSFAEKVSNNSKSTFEKAQRIVKWYAKNFDWTYTDYKKKSVNDILQRKGGNCSELAKVSIATMEALNLKMRKIREINIHERDSLRQIRAEKKVTESGFKLSVFGYNHNDHVWLEIYDDETGNWFPADPSIGVVGKAEWLEARFGFEERFSLDPASKSMLFPFAIFVFDDNNSVIENRTEYYAINGFNGIYNNELENLESWIDWSETIKYLNVKAIGAFQGEINLHNFTREMIHLDMLYHSLKAEYKLNQYNLMPKKAL